MKVGLYFGTFNPIHVGHLVIANYMATHTELDEVWLIVTPQNPLKKKSSLLADYHRLALVRVAIEETHYLRASDIEFNLPQPNYTVHTLAHLKEKYPKNEFHLIMGEDNLRTIHRWYNFEYILNNYPIYVYPRLLTLQEEDELSLDSYKPNESPYLKHSNVQFCEDAPVMKVSSSFVRQAIKEKKSVKYLVTEPVLKYIEEMHFYEN